MNIPPFEMFVKNPFPGRLISLDPGGTTGYAIWDNSQLVDAGQIATHTVREAVPFLEKWLTTKVYDAGYHDGNTLAIM